MSQKTEQGKKTTWHLMTRISVLFATKKWQIRTTNFKCTCTKTADNMVSRDTQIT